MIQIEFPLTDNECCAAPYWMILDPGKPNGALSEDGLSDADLSRMICGPFFSREEAQQYLNRQKHNFSPSAVVWSLYGRSKLYQKAWQKADEEAATCREK